MAIVYLQEFPIESGDTGNYDAVVAALDLQSGPSGLIVHTAGYDHDGGVFRILDIWESREQGERFMEEQLNPALERVMGAAPEGSFAPPSRETWYELHHILPD